MQPLPQPIFDAFERMKTKEKHIELKQMNDRRLTPAVSFETTDAWIVRYNA
jgi:hypothetical protein